MHLAGHALLAEAFAVSQRGLPPQDLSHPVQCKDFAELKTPDFQDFLALQQDFSCPDVSSDSDSSCDSDSTCFGSPPRGSGDSFTSAPRDFAAAFAANNASSQRRIAKCEGVPHVRQLFNWDCGLACVLMVLHAAAPKLACLDLATLRQHCSTTSIWTIDLAHLLRRFGMDVVFLTVTLGANPAYSSEAFYAENMLNDEKRVQRLFQDAPTAGIPVHRRSLEAGEVKAAMASGRYLAIVLVDKAKLGGPWPWSCDLALQYHLQGAPVYTGHYIVVVAYCGETDRYVIRDPASDTAHLTIAADTLEGARRSFGTDEDLLLVSTPAETGGFSPPGVDWARAAAFAAAL